MPYKTYFWVMLGVSSEFWNFTNLKLE
uniref:Uncharacterized protein n=1 Tax=Anguilla anguilla TaxID=7936 RepID=A0A0E9RHG0_ANGAN